MAAIKYIAALVLATLTLTQAQNVSTFEFLSRPDIVAPLLYVDINDVARAAPGYIFFTPNSPGTTNFNYGPYAYNSHGQLVWSGHAVLPEGYGAFNPQVIDFEGQPHVAYTQFAGARGGGSSHEGSSTKIYDRSYNQVREVKPSGNWRNLPLTQDLHEFNLVDDGRSAIMTSYITFREDVTYPHCGDNTTMYTKTGLFSEVSTDGTNTEIFQWCASDYIDPLDTYVCPGEHLIGTGRSSADGMDFFHINSVDKDEFGDYVVSGRHTSTLYKIAGLHSPSGLAPGEIIWRMGGRRNTFKTLDSQVMGTPSLNFSFQHHVRWNTDVGGVTIWNNGNNAIEAPTADASSGMSIRIDGDDSATLVGQYTSPGRQLDSSQGSHQVLPNGNHFLGMGSHPYMYEQTEGGVPVWYARFGDFPIQSYRAYKWEWTSSPPESEMGIFTYSKGCYGNAAIYASWNGATNIAYWDFYTASSEEGDFLQAASVPHNGTFETIAIAPFNLYSYAVAHDSTGTRIGQTPTIRTWTPSPDFSANCTDMACPSGTNYTETPITNCPAPGYDLSQVPSDSDYEAYLPTNGPVEARSPVATSGTEDKIPRRPRKFIR